jgi:hypothetical protein
MWLSNSSVGRKVVMSVTGIALVLFLTFHMAMNLVAIISADGTLSFIYVLVETCKYYSYPFG